ncbi:MAG: hypothetical protein ACLF0P_10080 [Thermoanaerobaculia bacterium]
MRRSARTLGTLAVLITLALTTAAPATATPPDTAGELTAGVLDWLQGAGALLGIVPPVEAGDSPDPERRVRGSELEEGEPTLTTLDGSTCEPGTTEASCSMDPDG